MAKETLAENFAPRPGHLHFVGHPAQPRASCPHPRQQPRHTGPAVQRGTQCWASRSRWPFPFHSPPLSSPRPPPTRSFPSQFGRISLSLSPSAAHRQNPQSAGQPLDTGSFTEPECWNQPGLVQCDSLASWAAGLLVVNSAGVPAGLTSASSAPLPPKPWLPGALRVLLRHPPGLALCCLGAQSVGLFYFCTNCCRNLTLVCTRYSVVRLASL